MPQNDELEAYLIAGTTPQVVELYRSLANQAEVSELSLVEQDYIIVDTETTGFDPARCSLIEIAAARICGAETIERFQTFVNPGKKIPEEIVELTDIHDVDVAGAPSPEEAVASFAEFAGGTDLVAHNASFDRSFVMRQAEPGAITGEWLDSLSLSQTVLPRFKSHRLMDLSRAFELHTPTHRATDDVEALAKLWRILLCGVRQMTPGLAEAIRDLSPETNWPLRKIFHEAAEAMGHVHFSLRRVRSEVTKKTIAQEKYNADDIPMLPLSPEEIEQSFAESGAASRMYEEYEQRGEQVDMALAVGDGLSSSSFRVLEAGTGVGKSMAYLLPQTLFAKKNAVTVGVATKTNALMDQLVYNELPRLNSAFGLSYVALKGYDHYPCLRKLENMLSNGNDDRVEVIQMLAALASYTTQTDWGDLDALNLHWGGLPRKAIQADPNDCLKRKCRFYPHYCYLHGARRHATSADVVVTNHALLFKDLQMDNGILPPIKHWVIDEAHAAESEARRQLSHTASARELDSALARLSDAKTGPIATIRRKAPELEGGNLLYGITADIDERIGRVRSIALSFFSYACELDQEQHRGVYDRSTLWIGPEMRESGAWQSLIAPAHSLLDKMEGLVKKLKDLISTAEQFEDAFASQQADLSNITCTLEEMMQATALVIDGEDEGFVYSVEISHTRDGEPAATLSADKLDVGSELANDFYPLMKSVVYTSATLATGDLKKPFGHFMHTTGLDLVDENRIESRMLASSYDFDHKMSILLPSDIPEPNAPGHKETLLELIRGTHKAMGGSVLTLFTNRREMEELYRILKPELKEHGIELIAQTRGASTKSLSDRFLQDKNLCLFALKSFWEGFDAPGDTLRCVIIPKLPFGRPDDPLNKERKQREGYAAWKRYSLPEAVIELKQAAGRLVRNSTDTGWIVLADARLQTKGYGKTFLRAMPTSDIRTASTQELCQMIREGAPGLQD